MSFYHLGDRVTKLAGADLSASTMKLVKDNGSGAAVLCGAGESPLGVLMNDPTSGQPATIQHGGTVKVMAGAAVTVGAKVASDASARVVTATSGTHPVGTALEAASGAGAIIAVKLEITLTPLA